MKSYRNEKRAYGSIMENSGGMQKFDTSDLLTISIRWAKWIRSFELFLTVNKVADPALKKAYLLHHAGPEVQEIFYNTLGHDAAVPADSDEYLQAKGLLETHFNPMKNIPYERSKFRGISQGEDSFEKFILKLRQQGALCDYGLFLSERIAEQIFDKANSNTLREQILQKKMRELTEIVELGQSLELLEIHKGKTTGTPIKWVICFSPVY